MDTTLSADSTLTDLPLVSYQVAPTTACKEVRDYFQRNPTLPGVLIVEADEVQAMVSRRRLLERLSRPYALDVFLKRPIIELPEIWPQNQGFLQLPSRIKVAEALRQALDRPGEDAYEPLVVLAGSGPTLLDVGDLLVAHAQIFQQTMELLYKQQLETQRYLTRLEEQQAQIRNYTQALELQQRQLQARSTSLETIQQQLFTMAGVFATRGGQAFAETFAGIDQITQEIDQIVQDSEKLRTSTLQIQSISAVVSEIAGRINLLALNTAVESERAGPQAKGMSVLAKEVRRLARETTQAAGNIQSIAQTMEEDTGRNVSSAQRGAIVAYGLKERSQAASRTVSDLRSLLVDLTENSQQ
ncbi:methyl-accepting chemotaxis protein [Anthocerotibacter panamensis]|uniref:methyl-accepting chemotaxis protein n=1 Tax=Anthocerotibacter panamensis TaxID=2857077 RepID=UPI001C406B02|nr:methyl-accepting chemotaxis protein [Anthocerotibacter panamensis]